MPFFFQQLQAQDEGRIATLDDRKPTFVFVHGAWGGSWEFKQLDSLLREDGYNVYRPSLTGLGERSHLAEKEIGLSTHVDDVVNAILFEELSNIVLVGVHYGGMVITGAASRLPERIRSLIYLDAFVPGQGESLFDILDKSTGMQTYTEQNGWIPPDRTYPGRLPPKKVPQPRATFSEPLVMDKNVLPDIPSIYIQTVAPGSDPAEDTFSSQAERARQLGWPVLIFESGREPHRTNPFELADFLHQNW